MSTTVEPSVAAGTSSLDQLKKFTKVVADTGDFESMKEYKPQDATTNPSLIYKAVEKPQYKALMEKAIKDTESANIPASQRVEAVIDHTLINFGAEILQIVPGRVSTETDARLSFTTEGSVAKGRQLIELYESRGISRDRILIKIASTWEGIRAAEILQKEGIHCNLTLLFSLTQAVECAHAKVQLISPFVGRIYDWYKKETGKEYTGAEDPGVQSVDQIYTYFKKFGHKTEVMGASFRNTSQITELAGCDLLTISPDLLGELAASDAKVEKKLDAEKSKAADIEEIQQDENKFRLDFNEDAMAVEKTAEGIRKFAADIRKLEKEIAEKLG